MTKQDRQHRVGELVCRLADTLRDLKRARHQANDSVPHLRALADCLDLKIPEASVIGTTEGSLVVIRDNRNADKRSYTLPRIGTTTVRTGCGKEHPAIRISNGAGLSQIIQAINDLTQEAASLAAQLKDEGIDLHDLCGTLDPCPS